MILYVDETEHEEYFIVAGLLVESKEFTDSAYKHFKNSIADLRLKDKAKRLVYQEFKSFIIDRNYKRIKIQMLMEISKFADAVIYSCYIKKTDKLYQKSKEDVYIRLLSSIVNAIESEIDIVFDSFNKKDFNERITTEIGKIPQVISIVPGDSILNPGLQFADNICSTIRLHKSKKDTYEFYKIIEKMTHEI